MPRDVQIAGGIGAAPQSYTVPNATEIVPRVVNATFDGSGAAGSFLPTLEIVSDGGVVIARCPTASAVGAGGSAEVSFFPNGDNAAGAGTSAITSVTSPLGTITVTNPLGPNVQLETAALSGAQEFVDALAFQTISGGTASASWSHVSGAALLDYTTPTAPTVINSGIYFLSGTMFTGHEIPAGEAPMVTIRAAGIEQRMTFPGVAGIGQAYWPIGVCFSIGAGNVVDIIHQNNTSIALSIETFLTALTKIA